MSGNQRLLLVLLVLLLAAGGGGLWWWTAGADGSGPGTDGPAAPRPAPRELEAVEPRPSDGGRVEALERPERDTSSLRTTSVEHPLEVELFLVHRSAIEGSELPPPGADANARLEGLARGNGSTGIPCTVTFLAGPDQGRVLESDSLGRFGASNLYQGLSMVRVEAENGGVAEREITLRQLSETQLNLDFSRRAAAYVNGRVVDPKGEPVPDAEVRLDGKRALTGPEGYFGVADVTPGKVPARVSKHGYAHAYQIVPVTHGRAIGREDLTFTLHPGATLEVRVEAAVGSPGPVQLYLFPVGGRSVSTGLGARTFPWHEINPVEVPPGGSTLVEGLQEGGISLLAFHPGAVASPPIVNKSLRHGRKEQHLIRLRAAPNTIRGEVLSPDGTPAKRARVRLEDPTRTFATTKALQQRRPQYLMGVVTPHLPAAVQDVTTDSGGRFVLTSYPEITTRGYYLTAVSADGQARASRTVESGSAEVELRLQPVEEQGGALEIVMGGRFQALPVELRINGHPREPGLLSADEELVIDGLEPGTWRIEVWWHHERVEPGKQLTIGPDRTTTLPLVLPQAAVEGPPQEPEQERPRED